MTRDEFYEEVQDFEDLINICQEYGVDDCDDIFHHDELSDKVDEHIRMWVDNRMWYELPGELEAIDDEYNWYRDDGTYFDFVPLSDYDLESYIDDVASTFERHGFFSEPEDDVDDEENDEDIDEENNEEYDDSPVIVEADLFEAISESKAKIMSVAENSNANDEITWDFIA